MSKKQILIGNSTVLKKVNKVRLLNELWFNASISRAGLSKKTGLDAKTITNICKELLEQKFIKRDEVLVSGRGRPAEMLKLNPEVMYSIGIDVGASHITAIIMDFSGTIIKKQSVSFEPIKSIDFIQKKLKFVIETLISDFKNSKKIKKIGLGIPGFIDRDSGSVINSVNFNKMTNFNIVSYIKEMFNYETLLEDSSRMMALGEFWFGGHNGGENFISIDLGYGIGMGIIQNGLLYRGANEISGEIGHIMINPEGQKCRCGKKGCLETIASGRALGNDALEFDLDEYGIDSSGAKAIFEAAQKGNKRAIKILKKAGYSIGIAIANVITLMDPGFVVVGGGLVHAGEYILEPLEESVREYSNSSLYEKPGIILSKLGDNACALGAAMIPIKEHFEIESIRL